MKYCVSVVVLLSFMVAESVSGEIPITDLRTLFLEQGRALMRLKGVSEGNGSMSIAEWNYPTSIVVRGVSYAVKGTECFDVYTTTNAMSPLLGGRITRCSNAKDALVLGFSEMGMTSMPIRDFANGMDARFLDPQTNVVYLATSEENSHGKSMLIFKNYFLSIMDTTNRYEFATAIMNAGLPEHERMTIPNYGNLRHFGQN